MPLVHRTVHHLVVSLALVGMLAGQLAAQCESDGLAGEPSLACMDLCTFTGSGGVPVQPVASPSTNVPACDCTHSVAPKTLVCRLASRSACAFVPASAGPALAVPTPPTLCRESIPSHDPAPAFSLDILRTTIIQS